MEYRHTPPSLSELRAFRRKVAAYRRGDRHDKSANGSTEDDLNLSNEEMMEYALDIILAHLENQNEILLELTRKIDRRSF